MDYWNGLLEWNGSLEWTTGMVASRARLSPPALYRIKNKKGESLEDFDHVLDMVGHG